MPTYKCRCPLATGLPASQCLLVQHLWNDTSLSLASKIMFLGLFESFLDVLLYPGANVLMLASSSYQSASLTMPPGAKFIHSYLPQFCFKNYVFSVVWKLPSSEIICQWWVGRIPGHRNYHIVLLQHPSTPSIPKAFSQQHAQTINQGACSINTIVLVYHFFTVLAYPFIPITYIFLYKSSCTITYKRIYHFTPHFLEQDSGLNLVLKHFISLWLSLKHTVHWSHILSHALCP